ncbi:hypothetical protein [Brevibacillus invocatus]|uniref:hypothetical protein n=1 Tax=Brevibacillus invocatus TaxID=173959 RepID=UPI001FEB8AC8
MADRFHKEGHDVYIIDNLSTGKKSNIDFKPLALHKSFHIIKNHHNLLYSSVHEHKKILYTGKVR